MPSPHVFRLGWNREKLAEYLLSRISFVAKPSTVSDDLGSDFFCTLFRLDKRDNREYASPLSSFAIQIKSNSRIQDFTTNIKYLYDLEIPFFWGVLNEKNKSLTVYSGENLPVFFSLVDMPKTLRIKPLDRDQVEAPSEPNEPRREDYTVMFPKILELGVDSEKEELEKGTSALHQMCRLMHANIATRRTEEYIFEGYDEGSVTNGTAVAKPLPVLDLRLSEFLS